MDISETMDKPFPSATKSCHVLIEYSGESVPVIPVKVYHF